MRKKRIVERVNQKVSSDIPASLAREIGRFLVKWAHFEQYIQAMIWECLELSPEMGRISVREPRVTDRIDMLWEIAKLEKIVTDFPLLTSIKKHTGPLAAMRHVVAHGLWTEFNGKWYVLLTRGAWKEIQEEIPNYPKGSKAVFPEGIPVSPADLHRWRTDTQNLIDLASKVFERSVPPPEPSPRKHRKRSDRPHPKKGQGRAEP